MKIRFIVFYMILFCSSQLYSQYKMDCNTLFVCIEKDDYDALFKNSYIKDTLFICQENTTKTTDDEYLGKYLIGEFASLEFFQPSSNAKFGDNLNDIGIEFKSRKLHLLDQILAENKDNSLVTEKNFQTNEGRNDLWYTALKKEQINSNFEISLLEYSSNYLAQLGFSKKKLEQEISPIEFNTIAYNNHSYPRKFKSLKSVLIEVNKEGKNYLKQMAKNFKFKFKRNFVDCNGFTIYYKLNKKIDQTVIKDIEINLTESLASQTLPISSNITLTILDNTAKFSFKH